MAEKAKARVPARRKKAKAKPSERTVLLACRKLVDPETGEEIKCFVPAAPIDRAVCQERSYRVGDLLLADLFKERNARFWRLAHQLCTFLRENVDEFAGVRSSHQVLKSIQAAARVECDEVEEQIDLGTLGKHTFKRWVPRSLNFFDMDDTVFAQVWERLCDHVAETYFPDWTPEQVEAAAEHWKRQEA